MSASGSGADLRRGAANPLQLGVEPSNHRGRRPIDSNAALFRRVVGHDVRAFGHEGDGAVAVAVDAVADRRLHRRDHFNAGDGGAGLPSE